MKPLKLISIILAALTLTTILQGQSPEMMSYQAVIRNTNNQLVINHEIGVQISILQGSANGMPVYIETQTPATNENGLVIKKAQSDLTFFKDELNRLRKENLL